MGSMQINGIVYAVPQEFDLVNSIDEHSETYRISLGKVNPTEEDKAKYDILFAVIDTLARGIFLDLDSGITFVEGSQQLKMRLATVDVYKKPYGTFYDIESSIKDTKIEVVKDGINDDNNRDNGANKNKTSNRKRKTTRQGIA